MKIKDALFCRGKSAFFFDDQRAIKENAELDGFVYKGKPVTDGFKGVRISGEVISIILVLEDGQSAIGDCAAVQYSGSGGRDPLFSADSFLPFCEKHLKPGLIGLEVDTFRKTVSSFENLRVTEDGKLMHTAIRYGLSQALLEACAFSNRITKSEVICREYDIPVSTDSVRIFGQCGDHRYEAVDKMILKEAGALPHGLINNIRDKLGADGGKLRSYIRWVSDRIKLLRRSDDYIPYLHIDVYGTVGDLFDCKLEKITEYLASLESESDEFPLYIEGPVDMQGRDAQIGMLQEIKEKLYAMGSGVRIVADEWCNTFEDICAFTDARACDMVQIKTPDLGGIQNTVEAVLYCRDHGMEAYQGGTCNETDISARVCVHAAMATQPDLMLAKPGMGFDEGFTIVNNEMQRIIALLISKKPGGGK